MPPFIKNYGAVVIWILATLTTLVSAYIGRGTAYENAFFYVLAFWMIVLAIFELYVNKR